MIPVIASTAARPAGYVLVLDGVDEAVDFGNHVFGERTQPVTISYWVKGNGSGHPISKQTGGFLGPSIYHGYPSTGQVQFAIQGTPFGGNALIVVTTSGVLSATKWTHIAITYDGLSVAAGVKIYVNGVIAATTTSQNDLSASSITTTHLYLGSRDGATPGIPAGTFLLASIAQMAVWNKELTSTEVSAIYSGRTFTNCLVVGPVGDLVFYVPVKSSDTISTVDDVSVGALTGTPANLESGDFVLVRLPELAQ